MDSNNSLLEIPLNTIAFPIIVTAVLGLLGLGLGYGLCKLIGQPRILTAAVLVLTLIPWFLHHRLIINHDVVSVEAALLGPGVVALSTMGALFLGGRARLLVVLLPVAAFLVSWYITIPVMMAVLPPSDRVLNDNIPTIWLAMWTIGATVFLVAYALPSSEARSNVQGNVE